MELDDAARIKQALRERGIVPPLARRGEVGWSAMIRDRGARSDIVGGCAPPVISQHLCR